MEAAVSLRIPQELLDRADRVAQAIARDPVTRRISRSDVLRAALEKGLDALERQAKRR